MERPLPLEPSAEDMLAMGDRVTRLISDFLTSLPEHASWDTDDAVEVARSLRSAPPEVGGDFGSLLEDVMRAAANAFEPAGPGYLAYIPGGGLFTAALATYLTLAINRYPGLWAPSPAIVQIEENVCRWLCDLFAMPAGSQAILTSGGSLANLSAIVTARQAMLGGDISRGTYYVSDQAHISNSKAARLAGLSSANQRVVPTDDQLTMDVDALRQMIRDDREQGLRPFVVVANAGSVHTGAIDPLGGVAGVARDEDLWMHVDGAYGGFFQLTERGKAAFEGIESADSITLDPHKGMFLPYGTGALVVRDGAALRDAHFEGATYLQDLAADDELPNYSEYSPELSREWRGLRVWMPLQLHGVSAFRDSLDEKLDLTRYRHESLAEDSALELPWEPQLSVVAFRLADGDDDANRRFLERINAPRRIFCSSTMIRDRYVIRACIVVHRTHRDRIDEAIEIIRKAAAEV
jgi:aromatic-L-amino-acid decarboxylase